MGDWADDELERLEDSFTLSRRRHRRPRRMSPFERARAAASRTKEIRDSFDNLDEETKDAE